MNVEAALADRIGPLAGRLHTGRSRNDQVATDLRLWTRRSIDALDAALLEFEDGPRRAGRARGHGRAARHDPHPAGPAGPVRPSPARLRRDGRARPRPPADARARVNISPLGAGALAGAGYPLDRAATAAELGFDGVSANSLDAVSDRDFAVETMAAVALGMVHLSRLAEEITWWSNPRFGFVRVADAFSTGSSMMPNKKNPDPAELVRGRAARVIGELTGTLTLLKGLPLAYQRDLQDGVAPLFDAVAVYESSLDVMAGLHRHADGRRRAHGRGRRPRATRPRRPSPTRWSGAAWRSGPPTTSSARSSPRPRPRACRSTRSSDAMIGLALGPPGTRRPRPSPRTRASATRCGPPPRSTARSPRATSSVARPRPGSPRRSPPPARDSTRAAEPLDRGRARARRRSGA